MQRLEEVKERLTAREYQRALEVYAHQLRDRRDLLELVARRPAQPAELGGDQVLHGDQLEHIAGVSG